MTDSYSRNIEFEAVFNFRDLGGYQAEGGRMVAWRRLFRSAELLHMTKGDTARLKEEIGLASVLNLQHPNQTQQQQELELLNAAGIHYFNVPFRTAMERQQEFEQYQHFSNMGEVYLQRISRPEYGRSIVKALEIIARPENQPLVFHCSAGKDRSGILAAMVLSALGVDDGDIIEDYVLTSPYMKIMYERWANDPATTEDFFTLPDYTWESSIESMALFLSSVKKEYGSARGYLEAQGAEVSLFEQLENALLV
jgi:protein-tyrosine phosphatase